MKKTWKSTEAEVAHWLGGVRVPLSGINSKHTSGDCMRCPFSEDSPYPEWLFTEVKRNKKYRQFFDGLQDYLRYHGYIYTVSEGVEFRAFELKYFFNTSGLTDDSVCAEFHQFRRDSVVWSLAKDSWYTAALEGKAASLLVFRLHGQHGLYCVAESNASLKLREWYIENEEAIRAWWKKKKLT